MSHTEINRILEWIQYYENKIEYKLCYDDIQCIPLDLPGKLYIGYYSRSSHDFISEKLKQHNIDLILSIGFQEAPLSHIAQNIYFMVHDEDTPQDIAIMRDILNQTRTLLSLIKEGKNIYVHCHRGVSRSATVILDYLIKEHGHTPMNAVKHLKKTRNCVSPNKGFLQLCFEFQE